MKLDNILSEGSLIKNMSFASKEFSGFIDSQKLNFDGSDFKEIKDYQLAFLGGFYAAKESMGRELKHLDDSFQKMYFSAVSSVNLLNKFGDNDLGLPVSFDSLNFNVSDYESNLRVLKSHKSELNKRFSVSVGDVSFSYFLGLNDILRDSLVGFVDDKYLGFFNDLNFRKNVKTDFKVKERLLVDDVNRIDLENVNFVKTSASDIIGNDSVKHALNLSMRKLFLYNQERGKNPALEKMQFKQNYLLVGEPGNGKGMLAAYAASVGSDLSSMLGRDLRIVSMENNSSYQDGPILKLMKYLKNISKGDDLYLVILDEVDSAFSSRLDDKTQNYQKKLVTELLKFTSNSVEYVNRGNYVLMAMTNTPNQLDPAFLNRMNKGTYLCEGPRTGDEKALLVKNLIHRMVPEDKVLVKDWDKVGSVAYDLKLSGRELKDCVENIFDDNCSNSLPDKVFHLGYDSQLSVFDDFRPITDKKIVDEVLRTGERRKVENYLLKGGYNGVF
jgi:hypothetical protein